MKIRHRRRLDALAAERQLSAHELIVGSQSLQRGAETLFRRLRTYSTTQSARRDSVADSDRAIKAVGMTMVRNYNSEQVPRDLLNEVA